MELHDYQSTLFPYAYNILGSIEDAKDVIQDIVIKSLAYPNVEVKNLTGYMIKSVINESINRKKRNQKLVGDRVWLPEPLATEKADASIDQEEIISYSLLVMLEKLSAKERAVFILKEGFDYSHEEIANTMSLSVENSRKLLSRAKNRLNKSTNDIGHQESFYTSAYLRNYIAAIKNGDVAELEKLLAEDVLLMADGGQHIKVVRELTEGKKPTLNLLRYVFKTFQKNQLVEISEINHQPALLFFEEDKLLNCQVFELKNQQIQSIFSIVDPLKLKRVHDSACHIS